MPETPAKGFRLRPRYRRTLERLARARGQSPREIVEQALAHLDGTLKNRLPIYPLYPDDDQPGSHKAAAGGH